MVADDPSSDDSAVWRYHFEFNTSNTSDPLIEISRANITHVYMGTRIVGIALDIASSNLFIADAGKQQIVKNDYSESWIQTKQHKGVNFVLLKESNETLHLGGIACGQKKIYWTNT